MCTRILFAVVNTQAASRTADVFPTSAHERLTVAMELAMPLLQLRCKAGNAQRSTRPEDAEIRSGRRHSVRQQGQYVRMAGAEVFDVAVHVRATRARSTSQESWWQKSHRDQECSGRSAWLRVHRQTTHAAFCKHVNVVHSAMVLDLVGDCTSGDSGFTRT